MAAWSILRANGREETLTSSIRQVSSGAPLLQNDSSPGVMRFCTSGECSAASLRLSDWFRFVIGAAVPIALWFAHKRWPERKLNKVSSTVSLFALNGKTLMIFMLQVVFPIICSGATVVPQ